MRRGRPAAARGRKSGGDGGRKEVELTGGVHRPVRERGRERRWADAADWAERRKMGRARSEVKERERELGRKRNGPAGWVGKGVWVSFFLFFFKSFLTQIFYTFLIQTFKKFHKPFHNYF
jgi:hypothetical protein